MLYVMLYGRYPFEAPAGSAQPKATEILAMLDNMVRQNYRLAPEVEISPECKDLLVRMLLPDPKVCVDVLHGVACVHAWGLPCGVCLTLVHNRDCNTHAHIPPQICMGQQGWEYNGRAVTEAGMQASLLHALSNGLLRALLGCKCLWCCLMSMTRVGDSNAQSLNSQSSRWPGQISPCMHACPACRHASAWRR